MNSLQSNAPGKIVLSGEYVVLDGVPAIGVAVDARSNVTVSASESDLHTVICPGFLDQQLRFSVDEKKNFHLRQGSDVDVGLLQAVWRECGGSEDVALDLSLDSRGFFDIDSGKKLGLGSSASLTVALCGALGAWRNEAIELDTMIRAHRNFQSGRGSGIDVAVAYTGGVCVYKAAANAEIEKLAWPGGLELSVFWSGRESRTADRIISYQGSGQRHDSHAGLANASLNLCDVWSTASVADLLAALRDYTSRLAEFSDDYRLDIFAAGHREMANMADKLGVVYKPSGAGGGDVGVALSSDKESMQRFIKRAAEMNFCRLHTDIDINGLRTKTI